MARTKFLQQVFWNDDRRMPKAATSPSPEEMLIAVEEEREAERARRRERDKKQRIAKDELTLQLYRVFQLQLSGRTIPEIAATLGINERTARNYCSQYVAKLKEAQRREKFSRSHSKGKKGV